jgi:hypothetical protein
VSQKNCRLCRHYQRVMDQPPWGACRVPLPPWFDSAYGIPDPGIQGKDHEKYAQECEHYEEGTGIDE